jgi:drug/metabolite transporter (DMT)-like permease
VLTPRRGSSTADAFCASLRAMSHRSAVFLLVVTSLLWSLGGVLIKSVDWHPMAKAGTRSAIAAVLIYFWMRRPRLVWSMNQILGAAAYVATVVLFVISTDLTTAANAIFLQYTAPAYVAVLGWRMLGERARAADWVCIGLAVAGIALLCRDGLVANSLPGILAGMGSGLGMGLMVVLLRREKDGSPEATLLLGNIGAAVIGIPFGFGKMPSALEWGLLGVLGVFQLGLPYILYALAIRRVSALQAILIPLLEPVLNPLWVFLFRAEIPGFWSLFGACLVLGGVLLRSLAGTGNPKG